MDISVERRDREPNCLFLPLFDKKEAGFGYISCFFLILDNEFKCGAQRREYKCSNLELFHMKWPGFGYKSCFCIIFDEEF